MILPIVTEVGVMLASNLRLDQHISSPSKFRGHVFLLSHMSKLIPASTISLLYKCCARPTVEYATPIWVFSQQPVPANLISSKLVQLARIYFPKLPPPRHFPDWMTSKDALNKLCDWESLLWWRQILGLVYFHHLFHEYFTLLSDCKLVKYLPAPNIFDFATIRVIIFQWFYF